MLCELTQEDTMASFITLTLPDTEFAARSYFLTTSITASEFADLPAEMQEELKRVFAPGHFILQFLAVGAQLSVIGKMVLPIGGGRASAGYPVPLGEEGLIPFSLGPYKFRMEIGRRRG
jgi:hypothetical protein